MIRVHGLVPPSGNDAKVELGFGEFPRQTVGKPTRGTSYIPALPLS